MQPGDDIRISNQFLITHALHFAQPQAYNQESVTITWVAEYNLEVSSAVVQNGEHE